MTEISWIITAFSLLGAVYNVRGQLMQSYVLWAGSNAAWVAINYLQRDYPSAVVFGGFFATTIYGILRLRQIRNAASIGEQE